METIITSLANSVLASGTISEAHILLGLFIITIIALRKARSQGSESNFDYNELASKIQGLQQQLNDLSLKEDICTSDLDQIRSDIAEIKLKLNEINSKIQP